MWSRRKRSDSKCPVPILELLFNPWFFANLYHSSLLLLLQEYWYKGEIGKCLVAVLALFSIKACLLTCDNHLCGCLQAFLISILYAQSCRCRCQYQPGLLLSHHSSLYRHFAFLQIPLAKKLKECGVFGVSCDEYLNYALANRREWEARGEEMVTEMKEKYANVLPVVQKEIHSIEEE
jgi:hypothetical protein